MVEVSKLRVGFIGLGAMGRPMCTQIVQGGFELSVFDLDADARDFVAASTGARAVENIADLPAHCDIILTMLPNSKIVRSAIGNAGLIASGTLVVDMSSSDPLDTKELGKKLAADGVILLDGPVSGGVRKAVTGELCIMLGGNDKDAIEKAESVLSTMGKVERTGDLGSGHTVKALNNYISAAGLAAVSEALIVARKLGIDQERLIDVVNLSTGRNVTSEVKAKKYMIPGTFRDAQFALNLMAKDVGIAADLASALKLELPGLHEAKRVWNSANLSLGQGADHTEMLRYLADISERSIAKPESPQKGNTGI